MGLFLALLPAVFVYPLFLRPGLKQKRLEALRLQFKDAILSAASALNAGYSVEHAFAAALGEMERVYGDDSMICKELGLLLSKIRLNGTFEEAFEDFAARSGLEEVKSFAEVFLAAQKNGGELMKIIAQTAEVIGEKIRVQEDILTATASRRMEQRLMRAIPVLLVFYMELTSPGFFQVLYTTALGRLIMTCCLGAYFTACKLAELFLEIEV
jgi:tight adherence protein B